MGDAEKDAKAAEEPEDVTETVCQPLFLKYIVLISRTYCLLIIAAIWGMFIHVLHSKRGAYTMSCWYLLGLALFLTLMELIWIVNKCAAKFRNDGVCCACWQIIVWCDDWKKSILYIAAGIPAFTASVISTEAIIAGVLVFIAALFYFAKSFKECTCKKKVKTKKKEQTSATPLVPEEEEPVADAATASATPATPEKSET